MKFFSLEECLKKLFKKNWMFWSYSISFCSGTYHFRDTSCMEQNICFHDSNFHCEIFLRALCIKCQTRQKYFLNIGLLVNFLNILLEYRYTCCHIFNILLEYRYTCYQNFNILFEYRCTCHYIFNILLECQYTCHYIFLLLFKYQHTSYCICDALV